MPDLRDFAVVVGINQYEHPDLGILLGAGNDASAFVDWLKNPCSDGDLSDGQIIQRTSVATFTDLRRAFNDLIKGVGTRGRRLYIFVAGHGSGQTLQDAYVYASDHLAYAESCWNIVGNAERLRYLFQEVVVFLDCCRTRIPGAQSYPIPLKIDGAQSPGIHFYCFACSTGDATSEEMFDGRIHGVFSEHLLRALNGRIESAVDHEGRVTAHSLKRYLTRSSGLKPDFNPSNDQDLRRVVLAKGFSPPRRPLTVKLSDLTVDGCGVFNGDDYTPLPWKRTRSSADTIVIDREEECIVVVTVPDVTDFRLAKNPRPVLPAETMISL